MFLFLKIKKNIFLAKLSVITAAFKIYSIDRSFLTLKNILPVNVEPVSELFVALESDRP